MLHKCIDGRPLMEIKTEPKQYGNESPLKFGCTIGTHARHSHNMIYATIEEKEFTILQLIGAYISYFELPIAVEKLAGLGIINL